MSFMISLFLSLLCLFLGVENVVGVGGVVETSIELLGFSVYCFLVRR